MQRNLDAAAMTPGRKRPICHTCNTLMAGHKRPNGSPVCPIDTNKCVSPERDYSRTPSPAASPSPMPTPLRRENVIVIPRSAHYANPYYVEQQPMNPIPVYARPDRTGTPSTWVSTEPADDIPPVKPEPVLTGAAARRREEREDDAFTSVSRAWSTTSSTGSSSTLRRGFSNILGNARPLVSLFSAPREDVQVITQAARRNGLFTGLIHRPDPPPEVKQEELSPRRNGAAHRGVQRDHSWWIILGQSAEAVGHLLDMQERDEMERVGGRRPDGTPNVGAYPVDVSAIKHSWLDSAFAGAVGGFIVFYLLAVMIV